MVFGRSGDNTTDTCTSFWEGDIVVFEARKIKKNSRSINFRGQTKFFDNNTISNIMAKERESFIKCSWTEKKFS